MSDLISRQAAIDAIDEISREVDDGDGFDYEKWREYFCELPSEHGTNLAEVGTDLISRQDALDICDHAIDLLKGQFGAGALVAIRESITELPSAQPDIIRCKDCKHHWTHKCMDSIPMEMCDLGQTFYDAEHDFCSLAERREVTE